MKTEKSNAQIIEPIQSPSVASINYTNKFMGTTLIILAIAIIFISGFAFSSINKAHEYANQKAFVVDQAGTFTASAAEIGNIQQRKVELENHLNKFVNLMFAFDERTYLGNIKAARKLIGEQGDIIIKSYEEEELDKKLAKFDAVVTVTVDSIRSDLRTSPYKAIVFARQTWDYLGSSEENFLWIKVSLKNVGRSYDNPHGFLIADYEPLNTQEIIPTK